MLNPTGSKRTFQVSCSDSAAGMWFWMVVDANGLGESRLYLIAILPILSAIQVFSDCALRYPLRSLSALYEKNKFIRFYSVHSLET
jgi:hypothetical protein